MNSIKNLDEKLSKSVILSSINSTRNSLIKDSLKASFETVDKNLSTWINSKKRFRNSVYSGRNRNPLLSDISFNDEDQRTLNIGKL